MFIAMSGFLPMVMNDQGFNGMRGVQLMEEATGVHLNFTAIDQDSYTEQLNIMFVSQEYADFIGVPDLAYPGGIDALVEDEICIDLAPYLETCLPDFKANGYDAYETYAKEITSDTGKIVTIATLEHQATMGSVIRQDWLDAVGLGIPDTFDDLYNVLTAFKTELNVKYPILLTQAWMYSNNEFVGGYDTAGGPAPNAGDIQYHVEDGQVMASLISDNFRAYLEMLNQWWTEGLIGDVSLNIMNPQQFEEYIYANEVGFWVGQSDTISESTKESAGGDFNAIPIEEITVEPGATFKLYSNQPRRSTSGGWAISTQCEDPEMAMKLINWMWTEEGNIVCNYGEEGVTFNYDEDGNVVFTDLVVNNPNGMNALFNSCQEIIFFDFPFNFGQTRKNATLSNQAEIDSQTVWRSNRSDEMRYFGDLTVEESDIYSSLAGDISTYGLETISKFVTGDMPFSEWDNYVAQLEELGLSEMVALKQAAYDRFLAR